MHGKSLKCLMFAGQNNRTEGRLTQAKKTKQLLENYKDLRMICT